MEDLAVAFFYLLLFHVLLQCVVTSRYIQAYTNTI